MIAVPAGVKPGVDLFVTTGADPGGPRRLACIQPQVKQSFRPGPGFSIHNPQLRIAFDHRDFAHQRNQIVIFQQTGNPLLLEPILEQTSQWALPEAECVQLPHPPAPAAVAISTLG
jgi:hypothetical protein